MGGCVFARACGMGVSMSADVSMFVGAHGVCMDALCCVYFSYVI